MPVTDRRSPGTYVTIEDASYVAPSLEVGRTVFGVVLCDRGPHNRIVSITSKAQYHKLFGKPDYRKCSQTFYQLDKALDYTGQLLVCRPVPEDAAWSNTAIKENTAGQSVAEQYTFTNGAKTVIAATAGAYDAFNVGNWIYGNDDTITVAAQIVSKTYNETTTTYSFTLDRNYEGTTATGVAAFKYVPYEFTSSTNVNSVDEMANPSDDIVYYFYANGAGKFYNSLIIKGTRNTELEKYYINESTGAVLYPYMFMDIAVYQLGDDGSQTLLEGPWPVSLIPRYPTGEAVKDLTSGNFLFIEDVINSNSDFIRCIATTKDATTGEPKSEYPAITKMITDSDAVDRRLQVLLLLSKSNPVGTTNIAAGGATLENGSDGTGQYDSGGNLNPDEALYGLVSQTYLGELKSVDGSIEQLPEIVYPYYGPDYLVCGGFPASVQYSAMKLAQYREDCICLADTGGYKASYEDDLEARENDVPWNTWTAMLYPQYRKISDSYTGQKIWVSPVYHAIERHLYCDGVYYIAEPVAGIEKGAITEPIQLAYKANHVERGDLLEKELNPTIVEPQGKYFLTQLTTWKRLSVLKRAHVAKFVAYVRKTVPVLLKDIIQRKATKFWINQANVRVNTFLSKFVEGPTERYSILKSFSVDVSFDDVYSELNVFINLVPIRAIEKINVYIKVA